MAAIQCLLLNFLIVMVVTDPDNPPYQQQSMFLVPTNTPMSKLFGMLVWATSQRLMIMVLAYVRYDNVRVPKENFRLRAAAYRCSNALWAHSSRDAHQRSSTTNLT